MEADKKNKQRNRVNEAIKSSTIRLIGDDKSQLGIMKLEDALALAKQKGLDLVEIEPNANPPVAKLMNFGKFLFDKKKQKQQNNKKAKDTRTKTKEIKFRPSTEENDYGVKLRNLRRFLEDGNKVKVSVWFRGREVSHHEIGTKLLDRIKLDLEDIAKLEFASKLEGRQLVMILAPLSVKQSKIAE